MPSLVRCQLSSPASLAISFVRVTDIRYPISSRLFKIGITSSTKPRFLAASMTPAVPATGIPLRLATDRPFRSSINRNLHSTSSAKKIASASPESSMSTSSDKDEAVLPDGFLICSHPCSTALASCCEPGRLDPRHNSARTAGGTSISRYNARRRGRYSVFASAIRGPASGG